VVIAAGILLAVAAVLSAVQWLGFHTSRLDLLDPEAAYNQRWLAYREEFGDTDDIVIVVEGSGREFVIDALEEVAAEVQRSPDQFAAILYRPNLGRLRTKSLYYLSSEQLRQLDGLLDEIKPVLQGDWTRLDVQHHVQWLRRTSMESSIRRAGWTEDEQRAAGALSIGVQRAASREILSPEAMPTQIGLDWLFSDEGEISVTFPWSNLAERLQLIAERFRNQHLLYDKGRLGMLLLRINADRTESVRANESLAELRQIVDRVQEDHPQVRIGLTGMPVLESDEMRASQRDSLRASVLSLVGVAIVFIAGFGGWRGPLLTVATLLLAIAWSCGFITLAVGHLNILSIAFGIILIGLGIDFGVHYLARYVQLRESTPDSGAALRETARSVGPGIVTGGLTTSLAFCTAALTHFPGVAELGIIAGGGILLCILAALVVLPAMIRLVDSDTQPGPVPKTLPIAVFCHPVCRHRRLALGGALAVTLLLALGVVRVRYDHNLLNLQPRRLESVALEHRLAGGTDRSVWFALSVANSRADLLRRKEAFEGLEVVAGTEEIASLVPESDPEKEQLVGRIHLRLKHLPRRPPVIPVTQRTALLDQLSRTLPPETVARFQHQLQQITKQEYYQRVSQFQQTAAHELLGLLQLLRRSSHPIAPSLDDVPEELRCRFVGRQGRFLLQVYGRGSIWDMEVLEKFVGEVESVDRHITGHPIQTYYASRQMQQSYVHAAVYSMLAVAIVLMLDFRSVRLTLLAMVPLGLGVVQLAGLLGFLDIPLNPANMIVLPLILGIGIDDGVHVVHDFMRQRGPYRMSNSTASAVVITSATTMIGFGSMMTSHHRGLQSLGQVLTLGVFCCLVSSLFVLPPLLSCLRTASQSRDNVVS
jgi:hopanoid biosynthesis associated RND transporter like protein HpnN